jgi:hypothetical protein
MRYGLILVAMVLAAACGSDADDSPGQTAGAGGKGGGTGAKGGTSGRDGGPSSGGASGSPAGGTAGNGTDGSLGASGSSNGGAGGASGASGNAGAGTGGSSGTGGSPTSCAPLPPSSGTTINVSAAQASTLHSIVFGAAAGSLIVLADGTYNIAQTLQLHQAGVTLRSASNDASKVVIDGRYQVNEPIAISASNVTVAHVTVTRAIDHPIHVYTTGTSNVTGTLIYGVQFIDGGEQFLKVNPGGSGGYIDDGRVECSLFRMTSAGRPMVEPNPGGCYTGGIDVHEAWNWVVRGNRFEGIYCTNGGLAEHAIHFWKGSRATLVENNVILDCARGIGFGLDGGTGTRNYPDNPNGGVRLAHYDGIIRNNVIWANVPQYDTGIELAIAKQPVVLHNTVIHGSGATGAFSSIDYRFAQSQVVILNNLTTRITQRDGATGTVANNLQSTPLALFAAPTTGDFHLRTTASAAIDQGQVHAASGVDIDGRPHNAGAAPDLGADEAQP